MPRGRPEGGAMTLEFHPLANIFPLLEGEPFDELVADVRAHGLREPIMIFDEKILDGRNRYRACLEAGSSPLFLDYLGKDPLGFVISKNLHRRHLTESQRAMVAANLATMRQGARTDLSPIGEMSQARAAKLLNVGKRSVERAAEVRDHGTPELRRAVELGYVSVSAAADVATLPVEEQRAILARVDKRELLEAAKQIRAQQMEQRRSERVQRLAKIAEANSALPSGRRYPIILADPPWYFEVYNSVSDTGRTAESHYPCMQTEDICKLPVANLATDDAALFLWTTSPHLEEAIDVIKAWGFRYVTSICWVKDKFGLGFYVRNQHELLLIATRGDMPAPAPPRRPASVIQAPGRKHSQKPDEAYELIERMYPELPKIELFARNARDGWAAWGNQAPHSIIAECCPNFAPVVGSAA
jgi:N6-adenosine-specific RNA methylase IME4/ParB-like chromosome segregation protein Spo0J